MLCASGAPEPNLAEIAKDVEVRITDAVGLGDAIAGADVLLAWNHSFAIRAAWPRASALRWIHAATAGVDGILFDELVDSCVVVTNARGVFNRPVAEFVLSYVLAVAKDTYRSHNLQLAREWLHRETDALSAQTALVVGTGPIGRDVAQLLRAVGIQVRGAGRTPREDDSDFGTVVASDRLTAHVGWADHVVVITPLTLDTRGIVDGHVIAAMKPSAHLINVARGPCVVEADLVAALRRGHLGGASLDVLDREPLAPNDPLWSVPRLHLTPHMAGDIHGFRDLLAAQFVTNLNRFVDGRPLANVVDKRLGYVPSPPA